MPETLTASIVIPTRGRADYLEVCVASVMAQARPQDAEVIVVVDGDDPCAAGVARRHGARLVSLGTPGGANAARNAGVRASSGDLIIFVDDDIAAPEGWLEALLDGARAAPEHGVFGGPIEALLEGGGPRSCGREGAPITTLDLGLCDREAAFVWSANMAVRRSAFERIGGFDEDIMGRGEEEEWQQRYKNAGGRIRYLAAAGVDHRRSPSDSTVRALARASYQLGRSARRHDLRKGAPPRIAAEVRTLAGCAWHTVRRRCANGIVMAAQAAGRLHQALSDRRS